MRSIVVCVLVSFGAFCVLSNAQSSPERQEVLQVLEHMETSAQPVQIYVVVALCDNENQGIVPVAPVFGNGDEPATNLYWGAQYGVKTFLQESTHWNLVTSKKGIDEYIAERCVFKHTEHNAVLIADAYRGQYIKESIERLFQVIAGKGGQKDPLLVVYIGHNGLMDFDLSSYPVPDTGTAMKDIIIIACASKYYFNSIIRSYPVFPVVWTTALCAPEAYVLDGALEAWLNKEDTGAIINAAATAYAAYQNCSINAAKKIFVTGW